TGVQTCALPILHVDLAGEVLEAAPVAVGSLDHHPAPLEQPLHHQAHVEAALVALLGTEREVLEVDEHGNRQLEPLRQVGHAKSFRDNGVARILSDGSARGKGTPAAAGAASAPRRPHRLAGRRRRGGKATAAATAAVVRRLVAGLPVVFFPVEILVVPVGDLLAQPLFLVAHLEPLTSQRHVAGFRPNEAVLVERLAGIEVVAVVDEPRLLVMLRAPLRLSHLTVPRCPSAAVGAGQKRTTPRRRATICLRRPLSIREKCLCSNAYGPPDSGRRIGRRPGTCASPRPWTAAGAKSAGRRASAAPPRAVAGNRCDGRHAFGKGAA